MTDSSLPEEINGLPNICGSEELIAECTRHSGSAEYLPNSTIDFGGINSAFASALHMHQPLIPAGGDDLETAKVISNLEWMMAHQSIGDNHNAPVFQWCYKRMGEFIPELVEQGKRPRIMLEYSGCLLHGLREMGLGDVLGSLRTITCDPRYSPSVEWLGAPWGHAVAPSTPVQDYRLHVRAWQHHFGALFGLDALRKVKGFSPSEMALPNQPDVCYEFVKTLLECGYRWVLVQEHSVETVDDGGPIRRPHLPHRLVAKNSRGDAVEITAIIKTQGSDTKLVAQGQPYYEAKGLGRVELGGVKVPPLVTQIADGENGGVMMNEFPPKYMLVTNEASGSGTPAVNVTEYLEYLTQLGVQPGHFTKIQPIHQKKIWARFDDGGGPEKLSSVVEALRKEDHQFHMEGGSWTNDRSWVAGYDHVLNAMEEASALFNERALVPSANRGEHRFRNALFHLLSSQTSCYRFWGEGLWTDYGRELCRRTVAILKHDF
jgi:hypothetical protein